MELTGCGPVEAANALKEHKEIWLAVDSLLSKPVVSGEKYIPKPPVIDRGLTEEQRERCDRGRWLQDQVNAVFSVAHSKTQTQPDQGSSAPEALPPPEASVVPTTSAARLPWTTSSPPDADERTPPPTLQSVSPLQISSLPQCVPETPLISVSTPPDHPAPAPHLPTLA
jgi:hypothetical protein